MNDGMLGRAPTQADWPDARVVIIDDEEPLRRVLAEMLRVHGYTDVTTFGDAAEAMAAHDELAPDLILLDLHMPGLDGVGVLEQLAIRPATLRPPVIVMTGAGHREHARRTLSLGAADFLNKPVDAIELLLRVRHQLRERRLRKELALHSRHLEQLVEQRAGELALLSRVLDDMPLPALVLTGTLDLHYANARGNELLQRAGGRVGEALAADGDERTGVLDALRDLGSEPRKLPSSIMVGGDEPRRVELSAHRIDDDLLAVLIYDVEERELVRDTLQRALEHETESARRMRSLEQLRTRFLTAVSHELRTPLTIIVGASESLQRHEGRLDAPQRHDLVAQLHRNATRLHRLLDDLLDLNRLSAGQLPVQAEQHDIADLVRSVLEEVELQDRTIDVDLQPCTASVEARQIRRAVANLLHNATVHTPPHTLIEAKVEPIDGGVRITVADHGNGVPDELKDRIFEPFEQGPTAPRHQPGTGIGLSLVREFVELHGGTVRTQETDGGGATFVIELPVGPA